jgi:hypothetical protein
MSHKIPNAEAPTSGTDRRDFLKKAGRFAVTVPPAMTVLLSTSMTSDAIAQSSGGAVRDGGGGGGGGGGPSHSGGDAVPRVTHDTGHKGGG